MPSRKTSLQLKVIVNVFITSVIMLLLYGGLIFLQIGHLTNDMARENLLEQARKIASYIEYDRNGNLYVDFPRRYIGYYEDGTSNHQFAVMNSKWEYLFSSNNFMKEEIADTLKEGGEYYFDFVTEDGQHFVGLKYDFLFEEKIYPVYIIEDKDVFLRFLKNLRNRFNVNLLMYGLPLLVLQGILIILIFKDAFNPIIRVARDARRIEYNNLSFRLNDRKVPKEVWPLIQSVNNGLARLEKSANAEKLFIANAAHELRTPISILKARIASLQNEKEIFALNEDLRNINRLISQMLDISRLDLAEDAPKEALSLNKITRQACEDAAPLFVSVDRKLSFEEKYKDQVVIGNEDMLERALLNLIENALKYTPQETAVKVIVGEKKIIVRDYGTPIPEEYRAKIFERFEKSPETMNVKGSGLGLAIVEKAMEIHNGRVILETRANGNDFILDFSADYEQTA